ncbi:hypothetical protein CAOG_002870 [Capsaspora owczarzaki ATCC 30864]|uniref:Uncharacterized protein n=2 Tax=Capsaspora owczarzaki (strain ATCC 30864) TaxID=595528 RepID=A0A0D2WM18_CAPO3|nr:hypothetical protein CAOG_002870 [Capsaspora owczarzaki ATCC 30864]
MQRLILLGNAICLDVLLYCFTVLPLRVAASLFRLMRYPSRRSATQIYATIQGAIVLCAVIAVDQLDVSETAYYFMRSQMNWAKLYSCFQLFSALDILVEQCGRRITGSLVWSVLNRSQRLLMAIVTFIYVFAHASIILVQIASVHVALDQGSELLSLMLSVQLVELKAAMVTSMTRVQLFKTCLTDIAQQFRWLIILFTIYVDKLSRYTPEKMKTSMPLFLQGATVVLAGTMLINCIKHAMYALNNTTWDIKTLYRSFGTLLLQPFEAGKLISDKSKHLSQHFDFVSLPYTVIAVRLFTICVGRSSMPLFVGLGCFAALCAFKFTIRFALRSLSQSIAQRRARQQNALRRLSTTISLVMGLNQAMKHKMDADRDHGILEEETASMVDVDEEPAHLD